MHTKFLLFTLGTFLLVSLVFFVTTQISQAPQIATPAPEEEEQATTSIGVQGDERIVVTSPKPGEAITSPLTVTGEARGYWFFEASFPVVVVNWDGLIIGQGIAQAQEDWMTEDFVPFIAEITFTKPEYGQRGAIILQKDNPSALPENDAAIEIPILFK